MDWSKATVWDCDDGYHCICLDGRHIESAESLAALQAFQSQLRAATKRAECAEKERDIYKSANLCNAATVDLLASQKIELKAEIGHIRAKLLAALATM